MTEPPEIIGITGYGVRRRQLNGYQIQYGKVLWWTDGRRWFRYPSFDPETDVATLAMLRLALEDELLKDAIPCTEKGSGQYGPVRHYMRVCACGRVLSQCRCPGPKDVTRVAPCRCNEERAC